MVGRHDDACTDTTEPRGEVNVPGGGGNVAG